MHGQSRVDETGLEYIKANRDLFVKSGERYEDAENYDDVKSRIKLGLEFLVSRPEEKIILTTHGALLKSIAIHILHEGKATGEIDQTLKQTLEYPRNTAINVIKYNDGKWTVDMWNDHSHFGEYLLDKHYQK